MFDIKSHALITDLYELTMMAVYNKYKIDTDATFEMFFRRFPPYRTYLVLAGLKDVIDYISNLHFAEDEVDYLRNHPAFKYVEETFFEYLLNFEFECDVKAVEEGEIIFPNEPILQVSGPLIQAQLIETYVLSMINFQTMIATKASRIKNVAGNRIVLEFGSRRAHSPYASVVGARAAYIGGFDGTSNVKAGYEYGINASGTIAHSYIMSFDSEKEAFDKYLDVFPENSIMLVDTYDSLEAVRNLVNYKDKNIYGIRLDSGDLLNLSKEARKILDKGGMEKTKIIVSSDLNEYKIKDLLDNGAPVDAFGVGTELITSKDAPAMTGVYKLVEIREKGNNKQKSKYSAEKQTYPGTKELYRIEENSNYIKDIIAYNTEQYKGKKLLKTIFEKGKLVYSPPTLNDIREKHIKSINKFNSSIKEIYGDFNFTVEVSDKLKKMQEKIKLEHS